MENNIKYDMSKIMDGIEEILTRQLVEIYEDEKVKVLRQLEFDEIYIKLQNLVKENVEVAKQLQSALDDYKVNYVHESLKHLQRYIPWNDKKLLVARLELLRSQLHKYTIEELASLIK